MDGHPVFFYQLEITLQKLATKRELKLEATPRTIAKALNRNGYHWCQVSKKMPLTPKQLEQRKKWVNRFLHKSPTWWT